MQDLTEDLRKLREDQHLNSNDILRRAAGSARHILTSPSQVSEIMSPTRQQARLQSWKRYEIVLTALGVNAADYRSRWELAQEAFAHWRARGPEKDTDYPVATAQADTAPAECDGSPAADGFGSKPTFEAGRDRRRRIILWSATSGLGLGLGLTAIITLFLVLTPSQVTDDTDPISTECSTPPEDQVYYTHLYPDWPANRLPSAHAVVEMHYSPRCRSVWAILHDAPPLVTSARLIRLDDGRELSCTADSSGACSTKQLNDAGMTSRAVAAAPGVYGETRSR